MADHEESDDDNDENDDGDELEKPSKATTETRKRKAVDVAGEGSPNKKVRCDLHSIWIIAAMLS